MDLKMLHQGFLVAILLTSVMSAPDAAGPSKVPPTPPVASDDMCPEIAPRKLDWKSFDGDWYVAASISNGVINKTECVKMAFDHKQTTQKVNINTFTNRTKSSRTGDLAFVQINNNGTTNDLLNITFDGNETRTYSFLDLSYDHYAVMFSCNEIDGSYEIYQLSRTQHLAQGDAILINKALAEYNFTDVQFYTFNNTDGTCSAACARQTSMALITTVTFILLSKIFC